MLTTNTSAPCLLTAGITALATAATVGLDTTAMGRTVFQMVRRPFRQTSFQNLFSLSDFSILKITQRVLLLLLRDVSV